MTSKEAYIYEKVNLKFNAKETYILRSMIGWIRWQLNQNIQATELNDGKSQESYTSNVYNQKLEA